MKSGGNYKFNYIVLTLLIAVFTSGHVVLVDALGLRLILQIVMVGLLLTYIYTSIGKQINKRGLIVIYIACAGLIGDLLIRRDLNDILGYFLLLSLCFTVLVMTTDSVLVFIKMLNRMNCFFAICATTALLLSINSDTAFKVPYAKPPYYSMSFLSGVGWHSLLSNTDSVLSMFGLQLPRLSAHLQQASLVPAYFLLPLGISLAFSSENNKLVTVTILLFCALTFGGNTYVGLALCLCIYLAASYVPRGIFLIMPFVLVIISSCLLIYAFIDAYEVNDLKSVVRSYGQAYHDSYGEESVVNARLGSGVVRLGLMGFQVIGFLDSFPLPAESILVKMTIGGNLLTNGLRGGVVGFIVTWMMYYSIFYVVSHRLKACKADQRLRRFGLSLIYSMVFQSFAYNDFGFSTYYGYMMFAIILVLGYSSLSGGSYHSKK